METDVARASRPLWRGHPASATWLSPCGSETFLRQRAGRPRYVFGPLPAGISLLCRATGKKSGALGDKEVSQDMPGYGWPASRLAQRYAATEFFQKNFSKATGPLPEKYSRTTFSTCGYVPQ